MNKVFISGNLTKDPEIRYTQSGKAMARMGIAVNRPYSKEKEVDFFNLVAWEKTAEFCGRYMTKGTRVLVEGRLQTYSYEGKDGVKRSGIDILIDNIEFAGSKSSNENPSGRSNYKNNSNDFNDDFSGEEISDEDVPF